MTANLVIVESPAKAKTIERYLGPGYTVLASYGHVRDLPENPGKGQLGVDVEGDFAPDYEIPADRRRQVSAIEKAGRGADRIFLATDLDREGEAIAWHVAEAAHLPADRTSRVTFSEITEPAIRAAFAAPRAINVLASYGHVRDLPENPGKGQLGVDVEHDFAPDYEIPADRRRQVTAIEKAGRRADRIFLATDLDREGEAIAWHVAEAAHLPRERTSRVTFSEITEPAIRAAFAAPRAINGDLVNAQQTRRIVDRLVGYTLSP